MPDAEGFEAFYRDNLARIVRACALVTLDAAVAEDLAAEAFARLWSRWSGIADEHHAGGFVFRTAMRLCWKETRRRRRPVALVQAPADEVEAATVRRDVAMALGQLPVRQRQAVVLRDWAGFETREVARLLSMRESTVRVHLSRARATLRASLSIEDREP